jgi:transcriptional regulator with XRE-family HTH domain
MVRQQQSTPLPASNDGADLINLHVCRRMKTKRVLRTMSQERLAKAIGISYQQLQRYESGKSRLPCSMLFRAALALEVPITYFFEQIEEDHSTTSELTLDKSVVVAVKKIQSLSAGDTRQSLLRLIDDLARSPTPSRGPA